MDINSLLSPQDSPTASLATPVLSPRDSSTPRKGNNLLISNAKSSGLHHHRNITPRSNIPPSLPYAAPQLANHSFRSPTSAPAVPNSGSFTPLYNGAAAHAMTVQRPSSTPGMDTLADLASMQHHQQPNVQNVQLSRPADLVDVKRSLSVSSLPTSARNRQSSSSLADLAALHDTPTPAPRAFVAPSLSKADLQKITELTSQLAENSYLYPTHVQLIDLLHEGLVAHLYPPDTPEGVIDALPYSLLADLRQAREAMNSRYPVGEKLWIDWIKDEAMLAKTIDDRVTVMELCQKAVEDEVGSAKLWRLYGDWMWLSYITSLDYESEFEHNLFLSDYHVRMAMEKNRWSEEDKLIGKELFKWETMLKVWERGATATAWHIDDSHLVWGRYLETIIWDLSKGPSPQGIRYVMDLFFERLQQPHATWDETSQILSGFVSRFDDANYEGVMIAANQQGRRAKEIMAERGSFETRLKQAADNNDKEAEWMTITEYLDWELNHSRQKPVSQGNFALLLGLSERANLRFPADADLWEDHLDLLMTRPGKDQHTIQVAARATQHCPWSGSLWSKRLVIFEASEKEFYEIEEVKHHATSTGLLEVGGMEELIKVYAAWCGYLRRRAFRPDANEDDRDIAEMGIRSAIDEIKSIGEKKYGKDFKGDPLFRVEQIYLTFLARANMFEEARKTWQQLSLQHGDQYEFWDRYYAWEMVAWGRSQRPSISKDFQPQSTPDFATAVLQSAIRRPALDWPEKVIELYVHHCAQHETTPKLQEALVEARRMSKQVLKRRAKERMDAEAAVHEQQNQHFSGKAIFDEHTAGEKRKRASETDTDGGVSPKRRKEVNGDKPPAAVETSVDSLPPKRDRENCTIIVKYLPKDCTEMKIRQFFRDCGKILSINMIADDDDSSNSATIEFESKEDVLSAQTKSMKKFDGQSIEIQVGTGTTLWVTNYPPTAGESFIRDLFNDFGEIVEVRFPSLQLNTHRRFCYVQFMTSSQAQAATELDGKILAGDFKLNVKISDPKAKKDREGAMHEGREVYVGNLDRNVSESDVKGLFAQFGSIKSVRIPRNMAGKSKGAAFVVFSKKEEAEEAAHKMNFFDFNSRLLKVSISIPNATGAKRQATTILNSASPEPGSTNDSNEPSQNTHRERTIALLSLPDTVNDARVQALLSPYGRLKKVSLRPDHQGAIVEFENIADAGKAMLGVDGAEIEPGRFVSVGTVADLMKMGPEAKSTRLGAPGAAAAPAKRTAADQLKPALQVRRPNQLGAARRGGRGGLGMKSAVAKTNEHAAAASVDETMDSGTPNDTSTLPKTTGKTNADFKAMIAR